MYNVAHVEHCHQKVTAVLCLYSGGIECTYWWFALSAVVHDTLLEQPDSVLIIPVSAPKKSLTSSPFTPLSVPRARKPWPSPHPLLLGEDEMEINISLQRLMMRPSWVSLAHS